MKHMLELNMYDITRGKCISVHCCVNTCYAVREYTLKMY
jgi:hypothetical protein